MELRKMEKNKERIVRIYELSEAVHNKDLGYNSDSENLEYIDLSQPQFVLKEYLQAKENKEKQNKVPTGRTFQINDLIEAIHQKKASGNLKGEVSTNEETGDFVYRFSLENNNLKADHFSNLETNKVEVVIPKCIYEKYMSDAQISLLEENLLSVTKTANTITHSDEKIRNYKLEKRNRYIKTACAVVLVGAVAVASVKAQIPARVYNYLQEQHALKVQEETDRLKQLEPTRSELQQMNQELDPWGSYMDQQREEHEKSRKLP